MKWNLIITSFKITYYLKTGKTDLCIKLHAVKKLHLPNNMNEILHV